MTAEKFIIRPLEFPVYGMVFAVQGETATHPIVLTATQAQARVVASAFTQASAIAAADWEQTSRALRALEVERGEDLYRDATVINGRVQP